jgi:hypothetical protein
MFVSLQQNALELMTNLKRQAYFNEELRADEYRAVVYFGIGTHSTHARTSERDPRDALSLETVTFHKLLETEK